MSGGRRGLGDAGEAALSEATYSPYPAEHLFDPLALSLTDCVAIMSLRCAIQPRGNAALKASGVRRDVTASKQRDEALVELALVGTGRTHALMGLAPTIKHPRCSLGFKQRRIDDQQGFGARASYRKRSASPRS
jgi:hypothetical protein